MTNSDHERERRAFWDACCAAMYANPEICASAEQRAKELNEMLAERDKRFPAPIGGE